MLYNRNSFPIIPHADGVILPEKRNQILYESGQVKPWNTVHISLKELLITVLPPPHTDTVSVFLTFVGSKLFTQWQAIVNLQIHC